jgi:erythromycin esterase-like protein
MVPPRARTTSSLLIEVRRRAGSLDKDPEARLDARQNAEVLAGAERYYRAMVRADAESWNVRDCHIADASTGWSLTTARGRAPSCGSTTLMWATPWPPTWPSTAW